ncbi:hypothetical protein ALP42_200123 [Pseudomonas savastanoi pv. nerii]|uniref:Uncharacterized protein n=1 Tax=Pseudomonas savastanoi pv. nerii TaxID=360921 RepID=A0AB74BHP5_PSESS|nr:hypothetical protein ALP42_200123 [Pseudomonas savastanoi pv. nerii]
MKVNQFAAAHFTQRREVRRQLCQRHVVQPEPVLATGFLAISVIERLADQLAAWVIQVGGCARQRLTTHDVRAFDDSLA